MAEHDSIGELVRAAREARGLSQAQLATAVGVGRPYITRLESGARGGSLEVLAKIASHLDIDLNRLKHPITSAESSIAPV